MDCREAHGLLLLNLKGVALGDDLGQALIGLVEMAFQFGDLSGHCLAGSGHPGLGLIDGLVTVIYGTGGLLAQAGEFLLNLVYGLLSLAHQTMEILGHRVELKLLFPAQFVDLVAETFDSLAFLGESGGGVVMGRFDP